VTSKDNFGQKASEIVQRMSKCEAEYDFTLLFDGVSEITDDIERSLFEAGCDDATLSMRSGRLYLTFSRRAQSMKDAIASAMNDVRKANISDFKVTQEMRDEFKRQYHHWGEVYKSLRGITDDACTTDQKPETEGRVLGS